MASTHYIDFDFDDRDVNSNIDSDSNNSDDISDDAIDQSHDTVEENSVDNINLTGDKENINISFSDDALSPSRSSSFIEEPLMSSSPKNSYLEDLTDGEINNIEKEDDSSSCKPYRKHIPNITTTNNRHKRKTQIKKTTKKKKKKTSNNFLFQISEDNDGGGKAYSETDSSEDSDTDLSFVVSDDHVDTDYLETEDEQLSWEELSSSETDNDDDCDTDDSYWKNSASKKTRRKRTIIESSSSSAPESSSSDTEEINNRNNNNLTKMK